MYELTPGQRVLADITSEAANAWSKTMIKSWKSYDADQGKAVMIASLANVIGLLATTDELRQLAIETISNKE